MDRRHLLALSGALAVGTLAGCVAESPESDDDDNRSPGVEPDLDDDQLATLVAETNGFAFDLYAELLEDAPDENLFASPASIAVALAMTYAGAQGETREQMREVLRYDLDDDDLHEAFDAVQGEFDERSEVDVDGDRAGRHPDADEDDDPTPFELSMVNSVWGQAEYPFEEPYLDTLADHYGGGLREVDYQADAEGAREEINAWVADETEERIDELLPQGSLTADTRLVLANAVYFLAEWEYPFSEPRTSDEPFTALDGTEHTVALMGESHRWPYAEVDGAQAVELPYVGEQASMLVILPPEGEFESYEDDFDGADLAGIVDALDTREGTVRLPRFEFDSGFELGDTLESMGMVDAFDSGAADFGAMADLEATGENLFIHEVYHDAFVAVDEQGTEAAAATGVVAGDESAPADPFEFVADRPFLFAIRDRPTETVLFLGRVVDPDGWA